MTDEMNDRLNKIVERYIWDNHRPKIKLQILQNSTAHAGLKLVNFQKRDAALKASWVKITMEGAYPAEIVYKLIASELQCLIWSCNLKKQDVACLKIASVFWKQVVESWCEYHYSEHEVKEDYIVWWNSEIRVQNKPVFHKEQFCKGLLYVSQLFSESACQDYGLSVMLLNMLRSAVPRWMKNAVVTSDSQNFTDKKFADYMAAEKVVKLVYNDILPIESIAEKEVQWEKDCLGNPKKTISKLLYEDRKSIKVAKLLSFQYRLMLKAVVTNIQLKHWKIKETNLCTFCEKEAETYKHLFFECRDVQQIWAKFGEICKKANVPQQQYEITYQNVISNRIVERSYAVENFICLIIKQYVYRIRCLKKMLTLQGII